MMFSNLTFEQKLCVSVVQNLAFLGGARRGWSFTTNPNKDPTMRNMNAVRLN